MKKGLIEHSAILGMSFVIGLIHMVLSLLVGDDWSKWLLIYILANYICNSLNKK